MFVRRINTLVRIFEENNMNTKISSDKLTIREREYMYIHVSFIQFDFERKVIHALLTLGLMLLQSVTELKRRYREKVKNYVCGMPSQGSD